MPEALTPTIQDIQISMAELGYDNSATLVRTYPLYHPDRQVFRVREADGNDVVIKIRKLDDKAKREGTNITRLVTSYRYSGGHFPTVRQTELDRRIALTMPFLGFSLSDLSQLIDLENQGYPPPTDDEFQFTGFAPVEIDQLVERLGQSHINFSHGSELIHGDVILPGRSPSNVVYSPNHRKLFLIDGEALAPLNDDSQTRFGDQLESVREWMYENLELTT